MNINAAKQKLPLSSSAVSEEGYGQKLWLHLVFIGWENEEITTNVFILSAGHIILDCCLCQSPGPGRNGCLLLGPATSWQAPRTAETMGMSIELKLKTLLLLQCTRLLPIHCYRDFLIGSWNPLHQCCFFDELIKIACNFYSLLLCFALILCSSFDIYMPAVLLLDGIADELKSKE